MLLLLIALPCELFPARFVRDVADDLITKNPGPEFFEWMFSLGGRLQGTTAKLASSLIWLTAFILIGEVAGAI